MLASELCSAVVVVHASINGSKLILHELGWVVLGIILWNF